MDRRLKLHEVLCETLGSRNVYYQPPNGLVMKYPAIVYKREEIKNTYADGGVYRKDTGYMATVIDKNRIVFYSISRFQKISSRSSSSFFKFLRSTTRSTSPFSSRNSAVWNPSGSFELVVS